MATMTDVQPGRCPRCDYQGLHASGRHCFKCNWSAMIDQPGEPVEQIAAAGGCPPPSPGAPPPDAIGVWLDGILWASRAVVVDVRPEDVARIAARNVWRVLDGCGVEIARVTTPQSLVALRAGRVAAGPGACVFFDVAPRPLPIEVALSGPGMVPPAAEIEGPLRDLADQLGREVFLAPKEEGRAP